VQLSLLLIMNEPVSDLSGLPTKEELQQALTKIEAFQQHTQNNRVVDSDLPTKEEWEKAKAEIAELREYAKDNRHRIKNGRALCALIGFISPLILFTGNITFGEKISGSLHSREGVNFGDLLPILGMAGTALGVIGADEIAGAFKKLKE
jgi:hypothetical protein